MQPCLKNSYMDNYEPDQLRAAMSVLCDEQLGYGISRNTFSMRYCDDKVVKMENIDSGVFQNVTEWRAWNYIQHDDKINKFFAPCYDISRCGTILIQARTTPLPDEIVEIDMPHFIGDYKRENLGMFDGRVVFHDYGLLNPACYNKLRMIKVQPY